MNIGIVQAVNFCDIFRETSLSELGHFKKEHLKQLTPEERKICMAALEKIEKGRLENWKSPENNESEKYLHPDRLTELSKKIALPPEISENKTVSSYKTPLIWIAKTVHSIFLWFQNTFLERISTARLLDKVDSFRQHAANASEDIRKIKQEILPEVDLLIHKYTIKKNQEIIQKKLIGGLFEIDKILTTLKSEKDRESALSSFVDYYHVDGIEDHSKTSFYELVYDYLSPIYDDKFAEEFKLSPYMEFNQAVLDINKAKNSVESAEKTVDEAFRKLESTINEEKLITDKYVNSVLEAQNCFRIYNEANEKYTESVKLQKEASANVTDKNTQENREKLTSLNSQIVEAESECGSLREKHTELLLKVDELKKEQFSMSKKVQKAKNELEICIDEVSNQKQQLSKQIRKFNSSFSKIHRLTRPFMAVDIYDPAREIFKDLFEAAKNCMELGKEYEKVKNNGAPENKEECCILKAQFEEKIDFVDKEFTQCVNLVQGKINDHMKELHELKYGKDVDLNHKNAGLDLERKNLYGLNKLVQIRDEQAKKIELLKLKYKVPG